MLLRTFIEILTFKTILKVRKSQLIAFFFVKKITHNQNSKLCKKTLYLSDIPHIFEWWVEFIHSFSFYTAHDFLGLLFLQIDFACMLFQS